MLKFIPPTLILLWGISGVLGGCGTADTSASSPPSTAVALRAPSDPELAASGAVVLAAGWNPVGLEGMPVTAVNGSNIAVFAYWDGTAYQTRAFTTNELNSGQGARRGLWVYATAGTNLTYSAADVVNSTSADLHPGWNLQAFPATAPIQGSSLVVRSQGNVVALSSVLVPQFSRINSDLSYTQVDVSTGGTLSPGRPYWVFATSPVTVSWGQGPPTASPTPGGSPAATAPVTSTLFTVAGLGTQLQTVSDDGQHVVALRWNFGANYFQDVNLANSTLTEDTSPYIFQFNGQPNGNVVSSADLSVSAYVNSFPQIGLHTRSTNSSAQFTVGGTFTTYATVHEMAANGQYLVYSLNNRQGLTLSCFKTVGGPEVYFHQKFPALDSNGSRDLVVNRGTLSDDGSMVILEDRPHSGGQPGRQFLRVADNGVITTVFAPGAAVGDVRLSGNGHFAAYAVASTPTDIYVHDIDGGTPTDDRVTQSTAGVPANNDSSLATANTESADGRFVIFTSLASNLVPNDTANQDIFLRDRLNRTTVRISVDENGAGLSGASVSPVMSRNGQWIVFPVTNGLRRVRNPAF